MISNDRSMRISNEDLYDLIIRSLSRHKEYIWNRLPEGEGHHKNSSFRDDIFCVHVFGREYTFASGSGVFSHEPKEVPGDAIFRESIDIGEYCGSRSDFDKIIDDLSGQFGGNTYSLITRNCNHFAEALTTRLLNKPFPGYVNRMANLGGMVSCLIPPGILGDAPVGGQQQNGSTSGSSSGFQVVAPRNRQPPNVSASGVSAPTQPSGGFAGKGMKLGVSTSGAESSIATDASTTSVDENERRERARAAALKRMAAAT